LSHADTLPDFRRSPVPLDLDPMGLADRDYLRDANRASTRAARGPGWSVTTWLIVLCVAVFVLDGFLPKSLNMIRNDLDLNPQLRQFRPENFVVTEFSPVGPAQVERSVLLKENNLEVGKQVFEQRPLLQSFLQFTTAQALIYFSPSTGVEGGQFWRFIGFQFLHANLSHLLFNMLGLYFFGPIVERYLGGKRFLAFYLLCGACGAFLYLLLNAGGWAASLAFGPDFRIPGLLFHNPFTPLVGASAGVFGVIMAGAFLVPNATVLLFFVIPMRLATLAYALVAVAVITVLFEGRNAGGEAAHLGGAIAGWFFIRRPNLLHDFFDVLGRVDPTSSQFRGRGKRRVADVAEVDRVLAKIAESGLGSLTERERRLLRDASRGR
ncbi:MAG: rhomboid family intramembrane serine protease, partial [Phycisphaerales bacterium]